MNARDFFVPDTPSFKRNVFGGSVGGPIKKDKTFFFGSYQGTRRREGQVAPVLPTLSPAQRTGDFSALLASGIQLVNPVTGENFVNNQVPVDPISANYIDRYVPLPNLSGNNFVSAPTGRIRDDQAIGRIDQNFSVNDNAARSAGLNASQSDQVATCSSSGGPWVTMPIQKVTFNSMASSSAGRSTIENETQREVPREMRRGQGLTSQPLPFFVVGNGGDRK